MLITRTGQLVIGDFHAIRIPVLTAAPHFSSLLDSDADIHQIASAIEADQSMASRILCIINSAFYSVKTGSIKQAIVYLGYSNIRYIILSSKIF